LVQLTRRIFQDPGQDWIIPGLFKRIYPKLVGEVARSSKPRKFFQGFSSIPGRSSIIGKLGYRTFIVFGGKAGKPIIINFLKGVFSPIGRFSPGISLGKFFLWVPF